MFVRKRIRLLVMAATAALLLLACDIEEDLRLNFDGSGTYRIKLTIPRELAEGFGDLRKQAEKDGFTATEGTTETSRFIVLTKDFSDLAALNDDHSHFELTITESGLLRRDYRLLIRLQSIGFGAYQRRLSITMPCTVTSASAGDVDGSRVQWNASKGGSLEITASGIVIPVSRKTSVIAIVAVILGLALLASRRKSPKAGQETVCINCHTHLAPKARFCGRCGTNAEAAQM